MSKNNKRKPVVKATKLTKNYVEMHNDPKLMKSSKAIFDKITANHLSYLVRLQNEEINKDFPEDIPKYLLWPGKSLFPVERKPAIKQEILAEVEAEEFTENTPKERRRRPRYAGTYNVETLAASTSKAVAEPLKRRKTTSMSSDCSKVSVSKVAAKPTRQSPRKKTVSESSQSSKSSFAARKPEEKGKKAVPGSFQSNKTEKLEAKRQKTFSESSQSSSTSKVCSSVSVAPLKLKITVDESMRSILTSSSSSSDSSPEKESPLRGFKADGQPNHQKRKSSSSSSSTSSSSSYSSSDSDDEKLSKTKKGKKRRSSEQRKPAVQESKLMKVSRQLALNTPMVVNHDPKPVVKKVAEKVDKELISGIDAIALKAPLAPQVKRKTTEKPPVVKQKKIEPPKIVEAPPMNPKTNKPMTKEDLDKQRLKKIPRIPKKVDALQELGGIFTVKNGWEKTEEAAKKAEEPKVASPMTVEPESIRTPPLPALGLPQPVEMPPLEQNSAPRKPRSPIRAPTNAISFVKAGKMDTFESTSNKFNRRHDSDDSSSDEEMPEVEPKASSLSSSSSESEEEEEEQGKEEKMQEKEEKKQEKEEEDQEKEEKMQEKEEEDQEKPEETGNDLKRAEDDSKRADFKRPEAPEPENAAYEDSSGSSSEEEEGKEANEEEEAKSESDAGNSPEQAAASDLEDVLLVEDDFEFNYEDDDDKDLDFEPPKSLAAKAAPKVIPKAKPAEPEVSFSAELDDLKMTFRKEEPARNSAPIPAPGEKARITGPKEEAPKDAEKSDFDRNTDEIMAKIAPAVDVATRRTLQQFFGNICTDFLEDKCLLPDSSCKHFLPDAGMVAQRLDRCALAAVDSGFNVAIQFPKLLMKFFGQFAEQFVKKAFMVSKDESRLARMVMECEKSARTHSLYRTIAAALSNVAQMPPYKATRFIINHHTDSPYAREVIVQMILSTGPDLIRNISYLQEIAATQTVPPSVLDKILANCITYQDPALPNLVLNLLMSCQPKQINELTEESVAKFLHLQLELTEKNQEREMKAAHVAAIVAQKPKQRPPPNI